MQALCMHKGSQVGNFELVAVDTQEHSHALYGLAFLDATYRTYQMGQHREDVMNIGNVWLYFIHSPSYLLGISTWHYSYLEYYLIFLLFRVSVTPFRK